MKKFLVIFVVSLFFIWILPLGAFIAPEKAKKACNGKRAICLCPHLVVKQLAKLAGKTFLNNASSAQKEEITSSSCSPDFIFSLLNTQVKTIKKYLLNEQEYLYEILFFSSVDYVPKV